MTPEKFTDSFVTLPEVMKLAHASKSKIYREMRKGRFPKQVKIGERCLWPISEINAWVDELKNAR